MSYRLNRWLAAPLVSGLVALTGAPLAGAAVHSLIVENGSGSGMFEAGTLVDVWANPYETNDPDVTTFENPDPSLPNRIFDYWGGQTATLADPYAPLTSLVMPAADVRISARYKDAPRWTVPDVLTYFPPTHTGVIFMFHGTGGCASCMLGSVEGSAFVQAALAEGYGVVAVQSYDRATRVWDPATGAANNVDLQRVAEVRRDLIARGLMTVADPVYLVGVSAGGRFASQFTRSVQTDLQFPVAAMALYVSRGSGQTSRTGFTPTIFVAAANDTKIPAADVLEAHAELVEQGVPTQYLVSEPTPLFPRRFWGIPGLSATDSAEIQSSIADAGFLDDHDYVLDDPETSGWESAVPPEFSLALGTLTEQMMVAYAGHNFVSHFTRRVLDFFANPVTVVDRAPSISGFAPAFGPAGTVVSIYGDNFIDLLAVEIEGTPANFMVISPTELRAEVPADAQSGPIRVTNSVGTATSSGDFLVDGPRILGFTPESGSSGTVVTISGENLIDVSGVTIGGMAAEFQSSNTTTLDTRIPDGAVSGPVSVRTPQGVAVSTTALTVYESPLIIGVSPTRVRVGETVTVTGENLAGAQTVRFDNIEASFSVDGNHQLRVVVPAGASGRCEIYVVTPGGTATSPRVRAL